MDCTGDAEMTRPTFTLKALLAAVTLMCIFFGLVSVFPDLFGILLFHGLLLFLLLLPGFIIAAVLTSFQLVMLATTSVVKTTCRRFRKS